MNSLSNYAHLFLCSHELGFVTLLFGQSFEHALMINELSE